MGKLSSLEEGKASTESVFSGLYLQQVFCFSDVRPAGLLRGPQFQRQGCVSLHIPSLVNIFLGQSGAAYEEEGCGSVSEASGCHAGVTWSRAPCTSNGPQARHYGLAPCWRYPKARSKESSIRRRKTAVGWIFKQLLGHTVLELPGGSCEFWPQVRYPGACRGCFPCRIQECSRQT